MRFFVLPMVFLAVFGAAPAWGGETSMRPGLWEVKTRSDLLNLVPHIPAEQMQRLMGLAKQYGLDMPQVQDGAATSRTCITQAMADQRKFPDFYQKQAGCSTSNMRHTADSYRLDFSCASAQVNGRGTAQGTFTGRETFSGRTTFAGTVQGATIDEHADITGRWIGASCSAARSP